jgi:hypothetical protein
LVTYPDRDADRDGIFDEPGAISMVLASKQAVGLSSLTSPTVAS